MSDDSPSAATAQAALDRALDEQDQLLLVYQPIHDARTGEIRAAEALLRQLRQSGEIREASIIHEAAEEIGGPELFTLDHILIRKAYADAARWQVTHPHVRLHVNLSPREFQEGDVLARLTTLVTSSRIDVRNVSLEITETSYIDHPSETMAVLEALKKFGVALWLDDFGTGHSSLTHLQCFPCDGLKLAGEFIGPLPDDRRCASIVRALIRLADELGLAVVAEEVERRDQLEFLLEHGCQYVQGFLFNKPMTSEEFQATLATFSSGQ